MFEYLVKQYFEIENIGLSDMKIDDESQSATILEKRTKNTSGLYESDLDYCGHYFVKYGKKFGRVWIILFTCMSTRAVHFEVVNSLKSASCMFAVSRLNPRDFSVTWP